jgi:hypothetical protein
MTLLDGFTIHWIDERETEQPLKTTETGAAIAA